MPDSHRLIRKKRNAMRNDRTQFINLIVCVLATIPFCTAICQGNHGMTDRETIDRMRDLDLQPEKILDAIKLEPGMKTGEAGSSYGYFTFKMSKKVGNQGVVFANDIDPAALELIRERCKSENTTNIKTVLGVKDDPLFPEKALNMIVVFDCLFEFSQPAKWIENTTRYLKPGGKLVIVDPDPSKMGGSGHFLSRKQIMEFAVRSGYQVVEVDDSFLKSHMIIVLQHINQSCFHWRVGLFV
jgi:ubiquinone/menaquinone biosynthesis C-methylase UbiE